MGAKSYWRLSETSGTVAASSVLLNEGTDNAAYTNVTLGQPAALPGSTATSAGFNGTSSYVRLPAALVTNASYQSVSLWFKTTGSGVLFSYNGGPITGGLPGNYTPALYVGSDGKLYGEFWYDTTVNPIASTGTVNDGVWHHAVLSGGGDTQTLYLDGTAQGTRSGTIHLYDATGSNVNYVGTGFVAGAWPGQPANPPANHAMYFTGSISDVGFFNDYLSQDDVAGLYYSGHTVGSLLNTQNRPSGNSKVSLSYDPVTGNVAQLTDANGGTWTMGAATAQGSSQVYVSSVLAASPADYWRLKDTTGSTAVNEIRGPTAAYNAVTLGATGPFSDTSAGQFNGVSSSLRLPANLLPGSGPMSVGMWFKTSHGGILLTEQAADVGDTLCPCYPALWVGSDGTLRGLAPADLTTTPFTGMANKCLDLNNFGTTNGTKVQLWDCTGASNQVWQLQPDGRVKNPASGRCLDVSGGGATNGTLVQLWDCSNIDNQTWQPQADGSWKNPHSGRCLDLQGPSSANGTQAWIWDCNGGAGQKWKASLSSASRVDDNKWHHAILASDGTTQTLYLDGAKQGSSSGPALTSTSRPAVYVGGGQGTDWAGLSGPLGAYFNGTISDVAFYHVPVSAGSAAAQYAALNYSGGLTPIKAVNVTDPGQKTITYHYDLANGGRLVSRTDGLNHTTSYGYDTRGFLNTTTDPNGVVATTGHDIRGNLVSRTACQNQATNSCSTAYYTYFPDDTTANPPANAKNDVVLTASDGRSSSSADATFRTTYAYDDTGNRIGVTTPAVSGYPSGRTTTTAFTNGTAVGAADGVHAPAGLPWKVTTPNGAVTTTLYFPNGDIASVTDPVGLVTSYTYDLLGRVTTKTVVSDAYPSGLTTTLVFDKLNRVTSQTDPRVVDRVTGAGHTKQTTTVYDVDGNITSQSIADLTGGDITHTTSATFNSHDQQVSTTDPMNFTTTFGYDTYGNKASVIDAAGNETDYVYDPNGHLLTTTLKAWTGDPVNPSPAADLITESRAYDPAGRLASVTDAMGWVTSYTYTDDGLTATITRSDPAHPGTSFVQESDTYDAAGNLTTKVSNNGATTTTSVIDHANRTTSTTLDPAGVNRTTSYAYSPDDAVLSTRVSAASGSSTMDATYDLAGHRTSQSVELPTGTGGPAGWWRLDESTGAAASDASGNQQIGALSSGVSWAGGAASFNGSTGVVTTAGPVLDTTASYSVSAWVNLSTTPTYFQTVVSQEAVHNSGFYLQYDSIDNRWAFSTAASDTPNAVITRAKSAGPPAVGTWTHLVGVFDAGTHATTLYVNGAQSGTATGSAPFASNGPLTIGRDKYSDVVQAYVNGSIGNVQVYPRVLSAADVSTLYGNGRGGGALAMTRLTTTRTLDRRGLITASTDPNGNSTTYDNDEAGRLTVTTAPTVNTETNGGTPIPTHPVTMTGYDTFGEATNTEDADGNVTTNNFDTDGRQVSTVRPNYTPPSGTTITATWAKTYTPRGQLATSTDPLSHQTSYVYDQLGRMAKVAAPNAGVVHTTYDLLGDQLSVTDPNGAVNQATYDYLGRKLTTTQVVRQPSSAAYTTTYAYNTTGGWLSSVTTPRTLVVASYGYDNVGERTSVTDGVTNTTTYSYDYAGRNTKTILPDGTGTTASYDTAGRQTGAAKLDTDGSTVLVSVASGFDANGNQTTATDGRGHTNTFSFDAANRLTSEFQPLSTGDSITTTFGYDAAGNRTRFTDGRGNPFITTYNTWNLTESLIEPSTPAFPNAVDRTFTTAYDATGQVATLSSPGGVTVTNTYNSIGKLTSQTGSGADAPTTDRTFGYDTGGRLTSASAPGGSDTFTLDDRGLLLSTAGPSGTSSFSYDADGLMTARADAAGTTNYTNDADDRLATITDASTGATLTYTYNSLSQVSQIGYGTGNNYRTIDYDHKHRLKTDTLKTSAGSTIASIAYGYDSNDNVATKTTTGFAGASTNTYTYDWGNRLTSWNNGTNTSNYTYDHSGNTTQAGTQTFAFNARNQSLTGAGSTFNYTARGTLASQVTGGTTVSTTNDAFAQTVTQGTQTYAYDALGRVVTDATSGGGTRTLTYTGTGNTLAGDGTSTYSRDPAGGLVGVKTGSSGVLAWTDKHTDVVADFTANGTSLAGSVTYGPLGTVVTTTGMTGNLGYQSGWTESSSGRVNMAARWYNSATGHFDNRDTVANNPVPGSVNANQYAYGNDNPMTMVDPDGHRAFDTDPDDGRMTFYSPSPNHDGSYVTGHQGKRVDRYARYRPHHTPPKQPDPQQRSKNADAALTKLFGPELPDRNGFQPDPGGVYVPMPDPPAPPHDMHGNPKYDMPAPLPHDMHGNPVYDTPRPTRDDRINGMLNGAKDPAALRDRLQQMAKDTGVDWDTMDVFRLTGLIEKVCDPTVCTLEYLNGMQQLHLTLLNQALNPSLHPTPPLFGVIRMVGVCANGGAGAWETVSGSLCAVQDTHGYGSYATGGVTGGPLITLSGGVSIVISNRDLESQRGKFDFVEGGGGPYSGSYAWSDDGTRAASGGMSGGVTIGAAKGKSNTVIHRFSMEDHGPPPAVPNDFLDP
jgi:large repetitive protein